MPSAVFVSQSLLQVGSALGTDHLGLDASARPKTRDVINPAAGPPRRLFAFWG